MKERHRINRQIRARQVRVIDEKGQNLGVMSTSEALALAEEKDLDLVEVAPNANPPVCRILDYGQWLYQQQKKEREARKKQKHVEVKEIKFTLRISDNDFAVKQRQIERFLREGHRVKITIRLRGRERAHMDRPREMMDRIYQSVEPLAVIERPLQTEGRVLTAVLAPRKSA